MNQSALILVLISLAALRAANIEEEAKQFIDKVNSDANTLDEEVTREEWHADTAYKDDSDQAKQETEEAENKWNTFLKTTYSKLVSYPWKTFKNRKLKRMFFVESFLGELALPDEKQEELKKVQQDMTNLRDIPLMVYKSNGHNLSLSELDDTLKKDYLNADEMTFYWTEWHDAVAKPMKDLFPQWLALENETAHLNGYSDISKFWQAQYEIGDFEETMFQLYKQVDPFFKELHAYVRYKLWVANGKNDSIIDLRGPIPASLLGWTWGVDVDGMYNLLVPYPQTPEVNVTQALVDQGYIGRKVVETANNYFESLGFSNLPPDFWNNSIFEKKGDLDCNPGTYDFSDGRDFRMVYCAEPTLFDFTDVHQSVGFIEYDIAYKNLSYFYKQPPNIAFQNAFGLLMEQLTGSPNYLKSLNILDQNYQLGKELEINDLMDYALDEVFFLPFGYAIDLWRWRVTQGKIAPEHYNCEYWKLRTSLEGVEPPVDRDETNFDVGGIPWFASGGQYIQYYITGFIKYNIMVGLCKAAGYYDPKNKPDNPLVFCDIHNSKEAGEKLREMMSAGDSKPWLKSLKNITGKTKLDASGLLKFYHPLYEWLVDENKKNNVTTGWTSGHNRCH